MRSGQSKQAAPQSLHKQIHALDDFSFTEKKTDNEQAKFLARLNKKLNDLKEDLKTFQNNRDQYDEEKLRRRCAYMLFLHSQSKNLLDNLSESSDQVEEKNDDGYQAGVMAGELDQNICVLINEAIIELNRLKPESQVAVGLLYDDLTSMAIHIRARQELRIDEDLPSNLKQKLMMENDEFLQNKNNELLEKINSDDLKKFRQSMSPAVDIIFTIVAVSCIAIGVGGLLSFPPTLPIGYLFLMHVISWVNLAFGTVFLRALGDASCHESKNKQAHSLGLKTVADKAKEIQGKLSTQGVFRGAPNTSQVDASSTNNSLDRRPQSPSQS